MVEYNLKNGKANLSSVRIEGPVIRTLDGLYSTLKNERQNTRIGAILSELEKRDDKFSFDSIATKKETRLKLLERQYQQRISNQ